MSLNIIDILQVEALMIKVFFDLCQRLYHQGVSYFQRF